MDRRVARVGETAARIGAPKKIARFIRRRARANVRAMRGRLPSSLLLVGAMVSAGCDKPPVDWTDPEPMAIASGGRSRLVVDSAGAARFAVDTTASRIAAPPAAVGVCESSLQTAVGPTRAWAGWWRVRPDSSAGLYVASSADSGRTWGDQIAVDTSDASSNGCDRPPPSLTTVGDDVYVAYAMTAPEGTGVFFAHVMSGMLHSPVAVIYGDRLVHTAIAAQDPRVAVAYENPNGAAQQIGLAFSTTQGHLFDWRTMASRGIDHAVLPAVALSGPMLAVAWTRAQSGDSTRRMVRVGRLQ